MSIKQGLQGIISMLDKAWNEQGRLGFAFQHQAYQGTMAWN